MPVDALRRLCTGPLARSEGKRKRAAKHGISHMAGECRGALEKAQEIVMETFSPPGLADKVLDLGRGRSAGVRDRCCCGDVHGPSAAARDSINGARQIKRGFLMWKAPGVYGRNCCLGLRAGRAFLHRIIPCRVVLLGRFQHILVHACLPGLAFLQELLRDLREERPEQDVFFSLVVRGDGGASFR